MLFPYAEAIAYRAVHNIDPPPRWWWWRAAMVRFRRGPRIDWRAFDEARATWGE